MLTKKRVYTSHWFIPQLSEYKHQLTTPSAALNEYLGLDEALFPPVGLPEVTKDGCIFGLGDCHLYFYAEGTRFTISYNKYDHESMLQLINMIHSGDILNNCYTKKYDNATIELDISQFECRNIINARIIIQRDTDMEITHISLANQIKFIGANSIIRLADICYKLYLGTTLYKVKEYYGCKESCSRRMLVYEGVKYDSWNDLINSVF